MTKYLLITFMVCFLSLSIQSQTLNKEIDSKPYSTELNDLKKDNLNSENLSKKEVTNLKAKDAEINKANANKSTKEKKKRTVGHYILMGGIISIAAIMVLSVLAVAAWTG
jgi:cytochrome c-type biogenesis protein CcmH/NrfG